MVKYSSELTTTAEEICGKSCKLLFFIDLAGHRTDTCAPLSVSCRPIRLITSCCWWLINLRNQQSAICAAGWLYFEFKSFFSLQLTDSDELFHSSQRYKENLNLEMLVFRTYGFTQQLRKSVICHIYIIPHSREKHCGSTYCRNRKLVSYVRLKVYALQVDLIAHS